MAGGDAPLSTMTSKPSESSPGRIGGIDYGTVRIGLAVTDPDRTIVSPLEIYTRRSKPLDTKYFQQLAKEERLVLWVVGLPVHLDGRESQKSQEARQFGKWLNEITALPVEFFDERFTSAHAEEILQAAELTKKRRKERLDMLAAQIMLTAYLESQTRGADEPRALEDPKNTDTGLSIEK
jgi:putative Holliday junction resolvase